MKKKIAVTSLVLLTTCLSAGTVCADNKENKKELVQNWCANVISAESIEDAEKYICPDESEELRQGIVQQIRELQIEEVTSAEVIDTNENKEAVLFHYNTASQEDGCGLLLFYKNENGEYIECQDMEIQQQITNDHLCNICNGTGSVLSGNAVACAICGGTGQQYIPNLYYDTVMGWTGGYIGCSGCGGSGYTSGYNICSNCNGLGIIY